jgi:DNA polymerase-3 subunit gamma/tau
MMATTELQKIPDTVLSRSQVYEFRTISAKTVAERLRYIAGEESIGIPDEALQLLARAGEGSMRDSLSSFDQVRAFAGDTITADDVVTVLGLVGRDLVLDMLDAVTTEDAPAAFALVERAIERGYDLRLLCRELARATRDLLILSVDPSRAADADVAAEGERDRLKAIGQRTSREDLLRSFDLLTTVEQDLKVADQPRFNVEMALLRLMHLRKLVPIEDLLTGASGALGAPSTPGAGAIRASGAPGATGARFTGTTGAPSGAPRSAPLQRAVAPEPRVTAPVAPSAPAAPVAPAPSAPSAPVAPIAQAPSALSAPSALDAPGPSVSGAGASDLKASLLSAIKSAKVFFYNTVVAQAYRVDVTPSRITFVFLSNQKVPKQQCEDARPWLESLAEKAIGARVPVHVSVVEAPAAAAEKPQAAAALAAAAAPKATPDDLRQEAMADPAVQALLEIFPVEKTKIEEL